MFALVAFVRERSSALKVVKKLCSPAEFFNYIMIMRCVIVDKRISDGCERALRLRGFDPIFLPADPSLGEAVCSHPDTVLFRLENEIFTTADYCDAAAYVFSDLREYAPHIKINFTSDIRGSRYPDDCKMNALVMGRRIFAKTDSLSPTVISAARKNGYELIHTDQGYPACTVLPLGEKLAITSDRGMAKVMSRSGIEVTLISRGHIALPPHEYGFIGGASGVCDGEVYFFGSLELHPDAGIIKNTIEAAGFSAISLSDEPLRDLGGMIFL